MNGDRRHFQFKSILLPAAIAIAVVLFAFLHPQNTLPFNNTETPPISKIEPAEKDEIVKKILDNGLTLVVKQIPYHSIVSIYACIRTGLSNEGEYAGTGISHFVEHMVFKGTKTRPPGAIEKEIKSYGGFINASTAHDTTSYYLTIPKEHFREALEVLIDMLMNAKFDEEEIKKEKNVVLNEIRLRNDDPSYRVMNLLWSISYLYHPYKFPIIGYEGLFEELTKENLVQYHATRYVPNNIVLGIAGDIDVGDTIISVEDIFGKYDRKKYAAITNPREPEQISKREVNDYLDINLGYIAMGFHTTSLLDRDLFALDVLNIILGEGEGSRFYKRIVKERELLYSVTSANYTPQYPGLFIIEGIGKPENLDEAQKGILQEIENLKKEPIGEEDLARAKKITLSGYLQSLETVEGQAKAIAVGETLVGDPYFSEHYVEGIGKVTGREILDVARKYLDEANLTVSTILPKSWPEKTTLHKEMPPASSLPEMIVLDNGIRISLKEDRRIPMVSIVLSSKAGLMAETPENNGISNLASTMLLKGTNTRKEDEIVPAFERLGSGISAFSGFNSFGVSMVCMKDDLDKALDILEDVIKNPSFPEDQIRKEKDKIFASILAQDDDIFEKGLLAFRKELFKNHPYGRRLTGEKFNVERLTRNDLSGFYSKWSTPQNLVISAVGDFEKNGLLKKLSKRFMDLQQKGPVPEFDVIAEPKPDAKREKRLEMHKEEALVVMGFQGVRIDDKNTYVLEVLSSVLSGQDGRLFKNIREAVGASYALGVSSRPGIDPGYIFLYVACSPRDTELVIDKLLEEITRVRKELIETHELEDAKKQLIAGHRNALQSNTGLATRMCLDELHGLGYANYLEHEKVISDVTKEAVRKVALTYLDPESYTLIVITPPKNETR